MAEDEQNKEKIKQIKILCRVINRADNLRTFIPNLTKYNNSRNQVKETDFFSKRPEQVAIHEKFIEVGIFYEHRRGLYNTLSPIKKNKIKKYELNQIKLMQILVSIKYHPHKTKSIKDIFQMTVGSNKPKDEYFEFIFNSEGRDWSKIGQKDLSESRFIDIHFACKMYFAINNNIKLIKRLKNSIKNDKIEKEVLDKVNSNSNSFLSNYKEEECKKFIKYYHFIVDAEFLLLTIFWNIVEQKQIKSILQNMTHEQIIKYINENFIKVLKFFTQPVKDATKNNINLKTYFKQSNAWTDIAERIESDTLDTSDWNDKFNI